jgi:ABC-type uncharacterized transport system substrate-binding protein
MNSWALTGLDTSLSQLAMNTYYLNWKKQFKFMSHPTNDKVRESEKEAIEEKEITNAEISVGNDQDEDEKTN